jgi:hypothetical protein
MVHQEPDPHHHQHQQQVHGPVQQHMTAADAKRGLLTMEVTLPV